MYKENCNMSDNLHFIHVGVGHFSNWWADNVIPNISGMATLVAVVDMNPAVKERAIKRFCMEERQFYTDLREALEKNKVDFITVATPPAAHESAVDLAIRFGCDIVCEKPVADDMESVARIYKKVNASGRKMIITMNNRFSQDKQSLEALITSGKYGPPHFVYGKLSMSSDRLLAQLPIVPTRPGHAAGPVGLICGASVHQIDIMRQMTGSKVKTVYASTWNPDWYKIKDDKLALVMMVMENGVRTVCEYSAVNAATANGWRNDYIRVECRDATLILDNRKIHVISDAGLPFEKYAEYDLLKRDDNLWEHALLIKNLIDWRNGGNEPDCSLYDNLNSIAAACAAAESSICGEAVDVGQYTARFFGGNQPL
jgi:predicted dehydrogenase